MIQTYSQNLLLLILVELLKNFIYFHVHQQLSHSFVFVMLSLFRTCETCCTCVHPEESYSFFPVRGVKGLSSPVCKSHLRQIVQVYAMCTKSINALGCCIVTQTGITQSKEETNCKYTLKYQQLRQKCNSTFSSVSFDDSAGWSVFVLTRPGEEF